VKYSESQNPGNQKNDEQNRENTHVSALLSAIITFQIQLYDDL